MTFINAILSSLLVMGLIASAVGYRHSLFRVEYSPEWYFSAAKVLLAIAFGMRLLFWDSIWGFLRYVDREKAIAFSDAVGGVHSNIFSIVIGLAAVYCSLKARHLLLSPEEQRRWHWALAWAHPSLLGFPRCRD